MRCMLIHLFALAVLAAAENSQATPPVVIRSEPLCGAQQVDPGITEIRVTFQRPMADGAWSWTTTPFGEFPETSGEPRLEPDGRTMLLPVRLQPDRRYVIGVNYGRFDNFRSVDGARALPWLLAFSTAADSEQDALKAAETLATTILAEMRSGTIDAVYQRFDERMRHAISREQLAAVWQQTAAAGGQWLGSGEPSSQFQDGYRVVVIPMRWRQMQFQFQVSLDDQDRIAGLYIRPSD